jgi:hypothetical protein
MFQIAASPITHVYVRKQTLARWCSFRGRGRRFHPWYVSKIQTMQLDLGDDVNISAARQVDSQDAQENLPTSIVG